MTETLGSWGSAALVAGWIVAIASVGAAVLMWQCLLRLRRETRVFKIVAEHANDGVILQKMDGTILWCNEAYCRILGRPQDFWIGRKPQKWVIPKDICPSDADIEAFRYDLNGPEFKRFVMWRNMRGDGSEFWGQFSLSAVDVGEAEPLVVLTCRDVSEQVVREAALTQAKAELEHVVNYDALTGLANRRRLMAFLSEALQQAAHDGQRVGLIHIDLDKFKEVNDTHGHAAGDAVLVSAARTLETVTGDQDLAARFGGDEFVLVLPGQTDNTHLIDMAERLLKAVADPVAWDGINLAYGASLGLALSEPGTLDPEDLMQQADFALYEVKTQGRGAFAVFDRSLRRKQAAHKDMLEGLAEVIRTRGLDYHFQPIVDLATLQVTGVEALARWNHPKRGTISPVDFIASAEEIGLLEEVDLGAMQAAVSAQARLSAAGYPQVCAGFNASFQTLSNPDLLERLTWTAARHAVPHDRIVIEVLETVLLGDSIDEIEVAQQIARLVEAGFGARLDDFGNGYAGLTHLAQMRVTGIKIDRGLIRTILTDATSDKIVRAILDLTRDLGLDVVAEGVESYALAHRLGAQGCQSVQGYAIARPMPVADLVPWLDSYDPQAAAAAVKAAADVPGATAQAWRAG